MAIPNDAPIFPVEVSLNYAASSIQLSPSLVKLLTDAREDYEWPLKNGRIKSQQEITVLEARVEALLQRLTASSAHQIIVQVSSWAGNYKPSHGRILSASASVQQMMLVALQLCLSPGNSRAGLNALSRLPGISLVIASKIYRFVKPKEGAAVDRHASYFFNSLAVTGCGTAFVREWPNKTRNTSRLATYSNPRLLQNLDEYISVYLPMLNDIANYLNFKNAFDCPVTNEKKNWTPADVEMAAYYWWARNGAR